VSIFAKLIDPITTLVGKFVPDKDKAAAIAHDLATLAEKQHHSAMMAQLKVNEAEASHASLFVSGWRPFIGWSCGVSMSFNYLCVPILMSAGIEVAPLDLATMMPVLMGMLGLGGMRTTEKIKKVART
jgi:hypothetical protein